MTTYAMKLSGNGQISIPAKVRSRWAVTALTVVDCGDHLVVRPAPADPVRALAGKYAGRVRSTDEIRAAERVADATREMLR